MTGMYFKKLSLNWKTDILATICRLYFSTVGWGKANLLTKLVKLTPRGGKKLKTRHMFLNYQHHFPLFQLDNEHEFAFLSTEGHKKIPIFITIRIFKNKDAMLSSKCISETH